MRNRLQFLAVHIQIGGTGSWDRRRTKSGGSGDDHWERRRKGLHLDEWQNQTSDFVVDDD